MKVRHELSKYLSLSSELKLYLMKCAAFCDAHLEQYQVTDDFYTETDIRTFSTFAWRRPRKLDFKYRQYC